MISLLFRVNKFAALLDELEQLLKSIAMMKELTLRSTDYLLSFGERMSTRIFAAYLNKCGVKARQVLLDVFLVSTEPHPSVIQNRNRIVPFINVCYLTYFVYPSTAEDSFISTITGT
jgi:aspartokinase